LSGPFVCRCLPSRSVLRFHVPLIEPDVRFSRIRLSEKVHAFACGERDGSQRSWSSPKVCSSHGLQYQHGPNRAFLCLAPCAASVGIGGSGRLGYTYSSVPTATGWYSKLPG